MKEKEALRVRGKFGLPLTRTSHFGHRNIIKYCDRPFLSPYDKQALEANGGTWKGSNHRISDTAIYMMNDTLIENINKYVMPEDTLYHIGDVLFASKHDYVSKCYGHMSRINCKNVHLIKGNHDELHLQDDRGRTIANYFKSVNKVDEITINGQFMTLYHYAGVVWEDSGKGAWLLYGHSHSNAEPWMNQHLPGRRSLDVGVDNAYKLLGEYRPFSFDEIANIFKNRAGSHIDHHSR